MNSRPTLFPRLTAVALLICIAPLAARAQGKKPASAVAAATKAATIKPNLDVVDAIVQRAIENKEIPGAVVLIGHNGRVIYRKAFGHRSLEPTVERMTVDTIFDMASLTKCLATGLSVMRMLENGDIRLNDPVSKYIPEFGTNGKEDITIRQLLTHYSGLRPDLDLDVPWEGYDEALRRIYDEKPILPPGARFLYS